MSHSASRRKLMFFFHIRGQVSRRIAAGRFHWQISADSLADFGEAHRVRLVIKEAPECAKFSELV